MYNLGICTADDLATYRHSLRRRFFRKACYVGLYEEAQVVNEDIGREWEEAILSQLAVSNGAFKRTSRKRLEEFDEATMVALRAIPSLRERTVVHDMAVSDGRTSCEFFSKLSLEFRDALEFYATDLCLKVTKLRERGRRTTVVIDDRGNPVQLMFPPFVLTTRPGSVESWLYPVNGLLRMFLMRTSVKRTLRLHKVNDAGLERHDIPLVCRELTESLAKHQNFHLETYDVFQKAPRSYSVVRAMNIFNRSYFPDAMIAKGIANVFESLEEGGVFIIGSNADAGSTVDGGIFTKRRGRFLSLYTSGRGSEIEHLICPRFGTT